MNASQTEAIAQADAELDNAALPTYSELLAALREIEIVLAGNKLASVGNSTVHYSLMKARAMLARAGGAA
jgi:rubrerythrin